MRRGDSDALSAAARERLAVTFALYEASVAMMRNNLRRRHAKASNAAIERMLEDWLRSRPGAPDGDADGRKVPWPRKRA